jgi:DNA-binding transcriptional LysR family regulator
MKPYDWEDLRHFLALGQTLNLGRAAALVGGSQVTVSRRVRSLESALDATLFVRRRDGHQLTPAGRHLMTLAGEAAHVLDGVSAAVGGVDTRKQGRVRIATTEVGINWMLLPGLAKFAARCPEIHLEIDASPQALDLMVDSETLALRFQRPAAGDYVVQKLGSVPYAVYGVPSLMAFDDSAQLTKGSSVRYVGWTGPFGEIALARWLRSVFAPQAPCLSLTTLDGHIGAARAGVGLVGLPIFVGRQFDDLQQLTGMNPVFSLDAWLVVPSQTHRAGRIRTVADFVRASVRECLELDRRRT